MNARMMGSVTLSLGNVCVYPAGMGQNVKTVGKIQPLLRGFLINIFIKTDRVCMSTIVNVIPHKYSHQNGQSTYVNHC